MKTVLLVEDDHGIRKLLEGSLGDEGFRVIPTSTAAEGLVALKRSCPDVIVLDWNLPDRNGLDVLREIRRDSQVPVMFLTVRDEEMDKVLGLECGADDYLTKPFSPRELAARLRGLLRRVSQPSGRREQVAHLRVDHDQRRVLVADVPIEMTRTEFDLLATLMDARGTVFTRERLLDVVWGYNFEGYQRTVDSHITRLRKKIEIDPKNPALIETVWGVGYRFAVDDADAKPESKRKA